MKTTPLKYDAILCSHVRDSQASVAFGSVQLGKNQTAHINLVKSYTHRICVRVVPCGRFVANLFSYSLSHSERMDATYMQHNKFVVVVVVCCLLLLHPFLELMENQ